MWSNTTQPSAVAQGRRTQVSNTESTARPGGPAPDLAVAYGQQQQCQSHFPRITSIRWSGCESWLLFFLISHQENHNKTQPKQLHSRLIMKKKKKKRRSNTKQQSNDWFWQSSPLDWLCAMQIGHRSALQGGMSSRNPRGHSQEFLQSF